MDVHALFEIAERDGRVGVARKSKPVDARAAIPGEVIVTLILGEGKETAEQTGRRGRYGCSQSLRGDRQRGVFGKCPHVR